MTTPWRNILHSTPFWGLLMAGQGLMWGNITLSMQIPPYFRQVHRLDIKTVSVQRPKLPFFNERYVFVVIGLVSQIGYLSGVPEICKFLFSIFYSWLTDVFLKRNLMSLTVARKLAVAVCKFLKYFSYYMGGRDECWKVF